jgi:hypothetical protein
VADLNALLPNPRQFINDRVIEIDRTMVRPWQFTRPKSCIPRDGGSDQRWQKIRFVQNQSVYPPDLLAQ